MICDHGEVVLVPFPFVDLPISKKRPALVLSVAEFNEETDHSILAMITTAKSSSWPSDHFLLEHEAVGLKKNCYVRWKTFTLPNSLILRRIGHLSTQDQAHIRLQMEAIFLGSRDSP